MFKATDFKLMRRNCSEELNELLRLLKIPAPSFDDGDEFEIYSDLDKAIDEKFCAKLNCKSDLDGYAKLLNRGGLKFNSNETRKSMLKKIFANREKIFCLPSDDEKTQHIKLPPYFENTIKKFVANRHKLTIGDTIEITILIRRNKSMPSGDSSTSTFNGEILDILEQLNKIFGRI